MKTNFRKSNDIRRLKTLFVMSLLGEESFPVPIRHLHSGRDTVSETLSGAGSLERQGKLNPIDLVLRPVHNARRVSTFL